MLNSYSVAMLRDIWKDKTANFAIVTALAAVPLVGAMGLAVDFGRSVNAKSIAQDRADEAMLSVARQGPAGTDRSLFNFIQAAIADDTGLQNVTVTGRWTTVNEFTVDIEGKLPLSLARVLPVGQSDMTVKVSSTGRYKQATQKAKAPQTAQLDPEAGDYNKIDAYCFNKEKRASSTGGRSQFVSIADNGGTTYTATMPSCADGETISFNLHNVRNQRGAKQNWLNALFENYDYYTDTTTDPKTGAEVYNLGGWAILETVLCPTLAECKKKSKGGIIPEGKNRTPQRATQVCSPGKYMYYGWEDRPPGRGSSDRDYDDIVLIISCPDWEIEGEENVRLLK